MPTIYADSFILGMILGSSLVGVAGIVYRYLTED